MPGDARERKDRRAKKHQPVIRRKAVTCDVWEWRKTGWDPGENGMGRVKNGDIIKVRTLAIMGGELLERFVLWLGLGPVFS